MTVEQVSLWLLSVVFSENVLINEAGRGGARPIMLSDSLPADDPQLKTANFVFLMNNLEYNSKF